MIPWLGPLDPFPSPSSALPPGSPAPGLLAASGELPPTRLLDAYRRGIFPWYSPGEPVLWWSPDPRMVLAPDRFKVARSLRKTLKAVLRDPAFEVRVDDDFIAVMRACAGAARPGQDGTWITDEIVAAYGALHDMGFAHSVETWFEGRRVGGLYGVGLGRMFFGESMFSERTDASKIALAALVAHLRMHGVQMLDCQQNTAHLASLGAREIPRDAFLQHLRAAIDEPAVPWPFDKSVLRQIA
ncbi:leucyl/phenylalanyl-tRNA--protein transferase [Chitinasiproducens palmae]|uniref:Leucyl/phenylalanyl-tRNA--protein transferase n=1 Tax=Chitinasiproducens palmae TaxID=1770053 RepID=A0A1H2PS39_9BURK|nr:leucyl/phenylalanyl-tRNA--protein transferase [Chitinasiproducens palmae]SDV49758.1 leucyl/phenylalanyl-tRNA--protein transferase [Chitinasiproducens palmae]